MREGDRTRSLGSEVTASTVEKVLSAREYRRAIPSLTGTEQTIR